MTEVRNRAGNWDFNPRPEMDEQRSTMCRLMDERNALLKGNQRLIRCCWTLLGLVATLIVVLWRGVLAGVLG